MPELPEVETIRRQLSEQLIGASIVDVDVRIPKIFVGPTSSPTTLGINHSLDGEVIQKISRVGKYLFIHFVSGRGLAVHLKMTGRLVIDVHDYATVPHTRLVITFKNKRKIYYWDTRMFGYIHVENDSRAAEEKVKAKLGPEPWKIDDTEFLRRLQKTGRAIKEAILDQHLLAGVGNIYASDGLWLAGIHPKRTANSLRLTEVTRLRKSLCAVLERGLATGGASDNSYVDAYGKKGTYQNEFLVYGRTGEPCRKCGRALRYVKIGGRGSWVCEHCQK